MSPLSVSAASAAIGAFVSTALLVADKFTDSDLIVLNFMWPGISAAYLFWGVTGGSANSGIAVAWIVNTVVYAAPVFVLVVIVMRLMRVAAK
jgi:hypothetical protein